MITLIVGSTGAGKTTYSRKIAPELGAAVYSIDNWMKELYGQDMPQNPTPEWFYKNQAWYVERIARCEDLIKKLSLERAMLGHRSFLDLGFSTKQHRLNFINFFQQHGIEVEIQFLDIPPEIRKARVEERNQNRGETFVMTVDDSLFDYMENIFETPQSNEGASIKTVRN